MSDMPAANDNFQQAANDNTAQDSTEPARKTASAGDVSTETTGDHRASYPPEPGEASPAKAEATAQKVPGNDTATQAGDQADARSAANDNFRQAANDNTAQDSTEPARKTASAGDVSTETTGDHRASYPPEPGEASPAKAEATAQKVPGNDTATQTDASQITNSAGSPESAAPKFNAAEGDQPRFASASDTSPVAKQYDPAFEKRAMGSDFKSGVYDPSGLMREKETAIADRLAAEGWRIDARRVDESAQHTKNPDVMVRKSADDPGVITEFKTLDSSGANALKRNINEGSGQVPADGEVVVDGRGVGTAREDAERAYRRQLGQEGGTVAKRVHVILGDGSITTFERK